MVEADTPQPPVEPLVLGAEQPVVGADVEGEVRARSRDAEEGADAREQLVRVRPVVRVRRAQVECSGSRRVGCVEVAAPRLDGGVGARVVERDQRRAVAAARDADDHAAGTRGDRPVTAVDHGDELLRRRGLPVAARAPVPPLRIGVAGPRTLDADHDRLAARRLDGGGELLDRAVRRRRRRQAVQEVDHRIAAGRRRVARREVHGVVHHPLQRRGREGRVRHASLQPPGAGRRLSRARPPAGSAPRSARTARPEWRSSPSAAGRSRPRPASP